jgi:hypothetical protein
MCWALEMRSKLRNGLREAFPTVGALIGLIRRCLGHDPLRPLGVAATLLSILVGAAVGKLVGWGLPIVR